MSPLSCHLAAGTLDVLLWLALQENKKEFDYF